MLPTFCRTAVETRVYGGQGSPCRKMSPRGINPFHFFTIVVLIISIILTTWNVSYLHQMQVQFYKMTHPNEEDKDHRKMLKYTVFKKEGPDDGYLSNVYAVIDRLGYSKVSYNVSDEWEFMWAHMYPFKKLKSLMMHLRPGQKVNKIPGSGFITNKVTLATTDLEAIPKAFHIPKDKDRLYHYARENPTAMFVQKNSNHRGIKIEKIDNLDLEQKNSFVQEFVDNPLLIDGYKFDIGIYTIVTSVDPLRVYVYEGDALVRFCPEKYYPFDPTKRDKYVVHDDYRPTWEVPTVSKLYSDFGYTFRETLNTHLRTLGQNPEDIWESIYDVIRHVFKEKEEELINAVSKYPKANRRDYFEMMRFDFILDANFKVYLMEANMSPNLSSRHFKQNMLLYQQVVYNLLRLVNIARPGIVSDSLRPSNKDEADMQVSDKDLFVFGDKCSSLECSKADSCSKHECWLCKMCLSSDEMAFLRQAFLEHTNRHNTKRVYPAPISHKDAKKLSNAGTGLPTSDRGKNGQKMKHWFIGKCASDHRWCH